VVCAAGEVNGARLPIDFSFHDHVGAWPHNVDLYVHDTPLERDIEDGPASAAATR
jgi:hypothetical protein